MRNIFILIAVLLSTAAQAQTLNGLNSGSAAPVAAATGFLLNNLSVSASFAFSTRRLSSAYNLTALQVRNSSGGAVTDIGFNGSGDLDTTALATAIGSNSGTVSIWYNQAANGTNNGTQSTAANQPRIRNTGANDTLNGHVAPLFDPSGTLSEIDFLSGSQGQPLSVYICHKEQAFNAGAHIMDGAGIFRILLGYNDATHYQIFAGSGPIVESPGSANTTNTHSFIGNFNGGSSSGFVDNVQTMATGNAGTNTFAGGSVGIGQGPVAWNGWLGDVIVFNGIPGTTDLATLNTSCHAYWGN